MTTPADLFVVNASPIITLAHIGQLDLLTRLAPRVLVPDAVAREVLAGPGADPGRRALESGWGERSERMALPAAIVEWSLGAGESEVLALAHTTPTATAVLDDAEARACGRALGIPVIGSLGVVLRAKLRQLIPAAAPLFAAMKAHGLYIHDDVARDALASVGEAWP